MIFQSEFCEFEKGAKEDGYMNLDSPLSRRMMYVRGKRQGLYFFTGQESSEATPILKVFPFHAVFFSILGQLMKLYLLLNL
jgi:hypothetical protein